MSLLPAASSCCDPCSNPVTTTININDLIEDAIGTREGIINVLDYGATGLGTVDDTEAVQEAATAAAGKTLYFPTGYTFIVFNIDIESNTIVTGGGTLKFPDETTGVALLAAQNKTGVHIHQLIFDGNIDNQSVWNQQRAAVLIQDTDFTHVYDCTFKNLIGDGVTFSRLGSPPYTGCSHCSVHHCDFLGDSRNRNGVSVICGNGVHVHHNTFIAMARPFMPGAIDFEPADTDDFVLACSATHNHIFGHELANLSDQLGIAATTPAGGTIRGLTIANNNISGNFFAAIFQNDTTSLGTSSLTGNNIHDGTYSIENFSRAISTRGFNCTITGNTVDTWEGSGIWVETGELLIDSNYLRRVQRNGLVIGNGPTGQVSNNNIIDGGFNGTNGTRGGIYFECDGVTFKNNRITSTATSISLFGFTSPSGTLNYFEGNYLDGIGDSNFGIVGTPQVWANNYAATQGSTPDTIGVSIPVVMPILGNTSGHTGWKIGNAVVASVAADDSAFKNFSTGSVSASLHVAASTNIRSATGYTAAISAAKVTTYNITGSDSTVLADTTAGGFTINLPPANGAPNQLFTVKKVSADGNTLTIDSPFSGSIDGAPNVTTTTKVPLTFQSDGTDWYIV